MVVTLIAIFHRGRHTRKPRTFPGLNGHTRRSNGWPGAIPTIDCHYPEHPVKRWLVFLLIALALLILLSPGIVGRLAERGIDAGLEQVSVERDDVEIAEESFQRGWFSSSGRHRIALRHGSLRDLVDATYDPEAATDDSTGPALVIDTRLDHGLIPVTSVQRDGGSLNPALASAVSTMQLDPGDGQLLSPPGAVYSFFGVGGRNSFRYLADAGSERIEEGTVSWKKLDLSYAVGSDGLDETVTADIDTLTGKWPGVDALLERLTVDWSYEDRTDSLGDGTLSAELRNLELDAPDADPAGTGKLRVETLSLDADSVVNDDRFGTRSRLDLRLLDAAPVGDVSLGLEMQIDGVDASALDVLLKTWRELEDLNDDPTLALTDPRLQRQLQALVSTGGQLAISEATFSVDPGDAELSLSVSVDDTSGNRDFSWPTVLLNSRASLDARIAASLYDALVEIDPQVRGALASGMLRKEGDDYVLAVEFEKGRLRINGAPMSLPIGGGLPR